MILLHGFPEFWYGWRHQIGPLAGAGLRVLRRPARDNLSEKPQGLEHYTLDALADDVVGLIDASGRKKAAVVGHDWGGIVAWWLALRHPDRVDRLAVLNARRTRNSSPRTSGPAPPNCSGVGTWSPSDPLAPRNEPGPVRRQAAGRLAPPVEPAGDLQRRRARALPGVMGSASALTAMINWLRRPSAPGRPRPPTARPAPGPDPLARRTRSSSVRPRGLPWRVATRAGSNFFEEADPLGPSRRTRPRQPPPDHVPPPEPVRCSRTRSNTRSRELKELRKWPSGRVGKPRNPPNAGGLRSYPPYPGGRPGEITRARASTA